MKTILISIENYLPWAHRLINLNNAQENSRIGFDERLSVGAQFAQMFLDRYCDEPITEDKLLRKGFTKIAEEIYAYVEPYSQRSVKYYSGDGEWFLDGKFLLGDALAPQTIGDVGWLLDRLRRSALQKKSS